MPRPNASKPAHGVIVEIPPPPELPILGNIFIVSWSRIFQRLCAGTVNTVIVHRVSHYQGLIMAIRRHNKLTSAHTHIIASLIYDPANGCPLRWQLRRVYERAKTSNIETPDGTIAGVSPWVWCSHKYQQLIKDGVCSLGMTATAGDVFRRWLYSRIYRMRRSLAKLNSAPIANASDTPDEKDQRQKLHHTGHVLALLIDQALAQAVSEPTSKDIVTELENSWLQSAEHFKITSADGEPELLQLSDDFTELLRGLDRFPSMAGLIRPVKRKRKPKAAAKRKHAAKRK